MPDNEILPNPQTNIQNIINEENEEKEEQKIDLENIPNIPKKITGHKRVRDERPSTTILNPIDHREEFQIEPPRNKQRLFQLLELSLIGGIEIYMNYNELRLLIDSRTQIYMTVLVLG